MPLHMALSLETNPAPAKYALSLLGKCAETYGCRWSHSRCRQDQATMCVRQWSMPA